MFDWLGIDHLVELTAAEAVLGFLTPLIVFAAFFVLQMVLPGRHVPGYVINRETANLAATGSTVCWCSSWLNCLWWFELTGMPRDWFYRSSLYAVAGGTVLTTIMTIVAVFSQPEGEVENRFLAWWFGRAQELQFFNGRFDVKMYFYVVGGRCCRSTLCPEPRGTTTDSATTPTQASSSTQRSSPSTYSTTSSSSASSSTPTT